MSSWRGLLFCLLAGDDLAFPADKRAVNDLYIVAGKELPRYHGSALLFSQFDAYWLWVLWPSPLTHKLIRYDLGAPAPPAAPW